jgi:hypothetical protein
MNDQLIKRALTKGGPDNDYIRGAVCYYRGFTQAGSSIGKHFERALRQYVATGSEMGIDIAYAALGRKKPKSNTPKQDEHWATIAIKDVVWATETDDSEELSPIHVATVEVKSADLKSSTYRWNHEFTARDLERFAKVYKDIGYLHSDDLAEFIDGFQFDMNPYSELGVWENMAHLQVVISSNIGPLDHKQQMALFNTLLTFSLGKGSNFGIPDKIFQLLQDGLGTDMPKPFYSPTPIN